MVLQIPRGERRHRLRRAKTTRGWLAWSLGLGALSLLSAAAGFVFLAPQIKDANVPARAREALTSALVATGFGIDQVSVTGGRYTTDSDVFDALDLSNVRTFASLDAEASLKRIERLPWVEAAQIARVYPGQLEVSLRERTPAVLWTRANKTYLVDATGRVLGPVPRAHSWVLPHVTGEGANADAGLLLAALQRHPDLQRYVSFAERVAERRWRLVMKNGTRIDLGADREAEGLDQVLSLSALKDSIDGAPMSVDVRTPGRITLRPLKTAALGALAPSSATARGDLAASAQP